jgi:hypothetical protein
MADAIKFRPGTKAGSDYTPALKLLGQKTIPKNNIIIGSDAAQVRFMAQLLEKQPIVAQNISDDDLQGKEGLLLHVTAIYQVDLSPEMRSRTGLWSADPITLGSSASEALIKYAYSLIDPGKTLKRDMVSEVSRRALKDGVEDVLGKVWDLVWLLSAELQEINRWQQPWESPVRWFDVSEPEKRLNYLYKYLCGYTFASFEEVEKATALKFSPSQQKEMQGKRLPLTKVANSIRELSRWRSRNYDPFVCALRISAIWS